MELELTKEISEIIACAHDEAMRTGSYYIENDHIILGIIRHKSNNGYELLNELQVSIPFIKANIDDKYKGKDIIPFSDAEKVTFSEETRDAIKCMMMLSNELNISKPTSDLFILAIMKESRSVFSRLMKDLGFEYEKLIEHIKARHEDETNSDDNEFFEPDPDMQPEKAPETKSSESNLEKYGINLTLKAQNGELDIVVGRDSEIERLVEILGRRKKNNPILIGEPGVGKSAIVEALALRIAQYKVPSFLMNKQIYSLDMGSLVAGTKFRGQFEERVKAILKEIRDRNDVVLFIDEVHTLVGAGGASGSLDAANMLKPALARGEIQCIGATTLDEYRQVIEKDAALERRFQKILVKAASVKETIEILRKISPYYEAHHHVKYSEEALQQAAILSDRYITGRALPDKAIDVMDEAGSRIGAIYSTISEDIIFHEQESKEYRRFKQQCAVDGDFEKAGHFRFLEKQALEELDKAKALQQKRQASRLKEVGPEDIAEVISISTGIPLNKIAGSESSRLMNMDKVLSKSVIGQDEAVEKITKAIRRSRAGLSNPDKPIGTFLFLGPTGVGKTHLAQVLSEYLFARKDSLIRIDMSEYMEKYAVSRLIGAPPGYVGYDQGGQLSEKVRRNPYSVVLLDEIEKAHPEVYNLLLQIMDEGRLTDSLGRSIDFRNTLIIMTSNIGSKELKSFSRPIGYPDSDKSTDEGNGTHSSRIIEKALNKTFTPEFLNRIDEIVYFRSLGKAEIEKICRLELNKLSARLKAKGYDIQFAPSAVSFLAMNGLDPEFGARPVKRAITRYVEDMLSELFISGKVSPENKISIVRKKSDNALDIKVRE